MKKLSLLPILFFFLVLFSACDTDKDPEVLPAAEAEMNRAIVYAYEEPQSALIDSYSKSSTESSISYDNEHLSASFGVPSHVGKDHISFVIHKSGLKNNFIGGYTLQSLPAPADGDAFIMYSYRQDTGTNAIIDSDMATIQGHFTVSAYDAKHQLISGTYEVKMVNVIDPANYDITQTNFRKCDITVTGRFTNVKVIQ